MVNRIRWEPVVPGIINQSVQGGILYLVGIRQVVLIGLHHVRGLLAGVANHSRKNFRE